METITGRRQQTCKYCHQKWLYWEKSKEGRWQLVDGDGDIHRCEAFKKAKEKENSDAFSSGSGQDPFW